MTRMVDVRDKGAVGRRAVARGEIRLQETTVSAIVEGRTKKGDVLTVAQVAGIQAVKDTPRLVPLCHSVPVESVEVNFEPGTDGITCTCEVKASYKTGVEMEALAGVSAALLCIWDMVKYLEKDEKGQYPTTAIRDIVVLEKEKGPEA